MDLELTRTVTVRLTPHDEAHLKAVARSHMRTPSQEIRLVLLQYLRAGNGKATAPTEQGQPQEVKHG